MSGAVRLERRGSALWVWIDRAARRNAINTDVLEGIGNGIGQATADPTIHALVLTGAGDKAFCAGADLSAGTQTFAAAADEPTTDFGRLARVARGCPVPLIARVNGACVAGGMGLLALCDLAIAAPDARFGLPEVKVGVFPMQVMVFLRRLLTARHIAYLSLSGALIDAQRAVEIGLINEVAPPGALDARVEALLAQLAEASPAAIKRGKLAIAAMENMGFDEALPFAEAQIALAAASADAREGLAAFNEKRKPRWAAPAGRADHG